MAAGESFAPRPQQHPDAPQQPAHQDRLVRYLVTFITTPFAFIVVQKAAEAQQASAARPSTRACD
jgi:hypothetical protein